MDYKGKAGLTLRCLYSNPRRMVVTTSSDVNIESRDNRTVISVQLGESGLLVAEIDVSISGDVHRFIVDSTTTLETQYVFHCSPLSA